MKRWMGNVVSRVSTAWELIRAVWNGPYWWLAPVLCVLLPAAVVFVFLQAVPIVAPFVYTVF